MTTRRIRRTTGAATTAAAIAVVAACSAPTGGTDAGAGGGGSAESVVIGVASEPDTLSPLLGYGKDGNSKIFDGLLARDADLKLKPALAKALPEIGDGGRTYTYTLRSGVTFSDGEPLTAEDVVHTYETVLDDKTNNTAKSELDAVEKAARTATDQVVFTLKYPYAAFAARTVLPIVPRAPHRGAGPPRPDGLTDPRVKLSEM
ncbi:hypothetical protein SHIRM173S_00897 [Streptomyces hirsutus]